MGTSGCLLHGFARQHPSFKARVAYRVGWITPIHKFEYQRQYVHKLDEVQLHLWLRLGHSGNVSLVIEPFGGLVRSYCCLNLTAV